MENRIGFIENLFLAGSQFSDDTQSGESEAETAASAGPDPGYDVISPPDDAELWQGGIAPLVIVPRPDLDSSLDEDQDDVTPTQHDVSVPGDDVIPPMFPLPLDTQTGSAQPGAGSPVRPISILPLSELPVTDSNSLGLRTTTDGRRDAAPFLQSSDLDTTSLTSTADARDGQRDGAAGGGVGPAQVIPTSLFDQFRLRRAQPGCHWVYQTLELDELQAHHRASHVMPSPNQNTSHVTHPATRVFRVIDRGAPSTAHATASTNHVTPASQTRGSTAHVTGTTSHVTTPTLNHVTQSTRALNSPGTPSAHPLTDDVAHSTTHLGPPAAVTSSSRVTSSGGDAAPASARVLTLRATAVATDGARTSELTLRFTCRDCGAVSNQENFPRNHRCGSNKRGNSSSSNNNNCGGLACKSCARHFSDERELRNHSCQHVTCPRCGRVCPNEAALKLHWRAKHPNCPYCKCTACFREFSSNEELRVHDCRGFLCKQCNKVFTSEEGRRAHQCVKLQCDKCQQVFSSEEQRRAHICTEFVCNTCGRCFSEEREFQNHRRQHVTCPRCAFVCLNQRGLSIHWRVKHPGEFDLRCVHCCEVFSSREEVRTHQCLKFYCEKCHKVFRSEEELRAHCCVVFHCKQCNTVFTSEEECRSHQCVPIQCEKCHKVFTSEEELRAHCCVVFHCKQCNTVFTSEEECRAHQCVQIQCEKCHNVFASEEHRRAHNCRGWVCKTCARHFSHRDYLRNHSCQAVTCLKCGRVCLNELGLRRHWQVQHRDEPDTRCYCKKCRRYFGDERGLQNHICNWPHGGAKHPTVPHVAPKPTSPQRAKCPHCGLMFLNECLLRNHVLTRHPEEETMCAPCGGSFPAGANHSCDVTSVSPGASDAAWRFGCADCGKAFSSEEELNSHHCDSSVREFRCAQCGRFFTGEAEMERHQCSSSNNNTEGSNSSNNNTEGGNSSSNNIEGSNNSSNIEGSNSSNNNMGGSNNSNIARSNSSSNNTEGSNSSSNNIQGSNSSNNNSSMNNRDLAFRCAECGQTFSEETELENHQCNNNSNTEGSNSNNREFGCTCGRSFCSESDFVSHVCDGFQCNDCRSVFRTVAELNSHHCSVIEDCKFRCAICHRGLRFRSELNTHKCISSQTVGCAECGLLFTNRTLLTKHKCRKFACAECGGSFSDEAELETHQCNSSNNNVVGTSSNNSSSNNMEDSSNNNSSSNNRDSAFRFAECGQTFSEETELENHQCSNNMNSNNSSKCRTFKCVKCAKAFATESYLKKHWKTQHPKSTMRFGVPKGRNCAVCVKFFKRENCSWKHWRGQHITVRCRKCRKPYSAHVQHKCKTASASASTSGDPDACVACRGQIECDKAVESCVRVCETGGGVGDENHSECAVCEKRFEKKGEAWWHAITQHTGCEIGKRTCSLFLCFLCGRPFANQSTLKKHVINHEDLFCCVVSGCGWAFEREDQVTQHRLTHHWNHRQPQMVQKHRRTKPRGKLCGGCLAQLERVPSDSVLDASTPNPSPAELARLQNWKQCPDCLRWTSEKDFKRHVQMEHGISALAGPDSTETLRLSADGAAVPDNASASEATNSSTASLPGNLSATLSLLGNDDTRFSWESDDLDVLDPDSQTGSGQSGSTSGGSRTCFLCRKLIECRASVEDYVGPEYTKGSNSFMDCLECSRRFRSRVELLCHAYLEHTGCRSMYRKFLCCICSEGCKKKKDLITHIIAHGNAVRFECPLCRKMCETEQRLRAHRKKTQCLGRKDSLAQQRAKTLCVDCTSQLDQAPAHVWNVGSSYRVTPSDGSPSVNSCVHCRAEIPCCWPVEECVAVCGTGGGDSSSNNAFQCVVCEEQFNKKGDARWHACVKHTGVEAVSVRSQRLFVCSLCTRYFQKQSQLQKHVIDHDDLKFRCTKCGWSFETAVSLSTHRANWRCHAPLEVLGRVCCGCLSRCERVPLQKSVDGLESRPANWQQCAQCHKWMTEKDLKKHCERTACSVAQTPAAAQGAPSLGLPVNSTPAPLPSNKEPCFSRVSHDLYMSSVQRPAPEKRSYTCIECDRVFRSPAHLHRHKQSAHARVDFRTVDALRSCPHCPRSVRETRLRAHIHDHVTGKFRFRCPEPGCDWVFKSRAALKSHYARHFLTAPQDTAPPGARTCVLCESVYSCKENIEEYVRSSGEGEQQFQCSECGSGYRTRDEVMHHAIHNHTGCPMGRKQGGGGAMFICPVCGWRSRDKTRMESHVLRHGQLHFRCAVEGCGWAYSNWAVLNNHNKYHHLCAGPSTGENAVYSKFFLCGDCFSQPSFHGSELVPAWEESFQGPTPRAASVRLSPTSGPPCRGRPRIPPAPPGQKPVELSADVAPPDGIIVIGDDDVTTVGSTRAQETPVPPQERTEPSYQPVVHQKADAGTRICVLCDATYNCKARIQDYITNNPGKNPQCSECGVEYPTRDQVLHHAMMTHTGCAVRRVSNSKLLQCPVCGYRSRDKTRMESHVLRHAHLRFRCAVEGCGWVFERKDFLRAHEKNHHRKTGVREDRVSLPLFFVCGACFSRPAYPGCALLPAWNDGGGGATSTVRVSVPREGATAHPPADVAAGNDIMDGAGNTREGKPVKEETSAVDPMEADLSLTFLPEDQGEGADVKVIPEVKVVPEATVFKVTAGASGVTCRIETREGAEHVTLDSSRAEFSQPGVVSKVCVACELTCCFREPLDSYVISDPDAPEKGVTCKLCNTACVTLDEALCHVTTHHVGWRVNKSGGSYSFECFRCKRRLRDKSSAEDHLKTHSQLQYKCRKSLCDMLFSTYNEQYSHEQTAHKGNAHRKRRECFVCFRCLPGIETSTDISKHVLEREFPRISEVGGCDTQSIKCVMSSQDATTSQIEEVTTNAPVQKFVIQAILQNAAPQPSLTLPQHATSPSAQELGSNVQEQNGVAEAVAQNATPQANLTFTPSTSVAEKIAPPGGADSEDAVSRATVTLTRNTTSPHAEEHMTVAPAQTTPLPEHQTCTMCARTSGFSEPIENYVVSAKDAQKLGCKLCDAAFATLDEALCHVSMSHVGCRLVARMRVYSDTPGNPAFECFRCTRSFRIRSALEKHVAMHSQLEIRCQGCEAVFRDWSSMGVHWMSGHGRPVWSGFVCFRCLPEVDEMDMFPGKSLQSVAHAQTTRGTKEAQGRGVLRVTLESSLTFKCDECNKNYKSRASLQQHQRTAHVPQPRVEQPIREAPQPGVPQPIRVVPQPLVSQPIREAPQPGVPQPIREASQPEVPQPIREAPQPEVPQPIREAPQPGVPQPIREAPQPLVPQPISEQVRELRRRRAHCPYCPRRAVATVWDHTPGGSIGGACDWPDCDRKCNSYRSLLTHVRLDHPVTDDVIVGCHSLKTHVQEHEAGKYKYTCEYEDCAWTYKTKAALVKHEQQEHESESEESESEESDSEESDSESDDTGENDAFALPPGHRSSPGSKRVPVYMCDFPGCQWSFRSDADRLQHRKLCHRPEPDVVDLTHSEEPMREEDERPVPEVPQEEAEPIAEEPAPEGSTSAGRTRSGATETECSVPLVDLALLLEPDGSDVKRAAACGECEREAGVIRALRLRLNLSQPRRSVRRHVSTRKRVTRENSTREKVTREKVTTRENTTTRENVTPDHVGWKHVATPKQVDHPEEQADHDLQPPPAKRRKLNPESWTVPRTDLCLRCGGRTQVPRPLNEYLVKSQGEQPFQCVECWEGFRTEEQGYCHAYLKHTGCGVVLIENKRYFCCFLCGHRYQKIRGLLKHLSAHARDDLRFGCARAGCDWLFALEWRHRRHQEAHSAGNAPKLSGKVRKHELLCATCLNV